MIRIIHAVDIENNAFAAMLDHISGVYDRRLTLHNEWKATLWTPDSPYKVKKWLGEYSVPNVATNLAVVLFWQHNDRMRFFQDDQFI